MAVGGAKAYQMQLYFAAHYLAWGGAALFAATVAAYLGNSWELAVFAGVVLGVLAIGWCCYWLQQIVVEIQKMNKMQDMYLWTISADGGYVKDKSAILERRIEALVQPGRETQRHVQGICYETYNLQGGAGNLRWACRMVIEEYCHWQAARKRFGECYSMKAWCVLCRAAREQTVETVKGDAQAAVEWCQKLLQDGLDPVVCTQVHRGAYPPPHPPGEGF